MTAVPSPSISHLQHTIPVDRTLYLVGHVPSFLHWHYRKQGVSTILVPSNNIIISSQGDAQRIKCLFCKHEDLCSNPNILRKLQAWWSMLIPVLGRPTQRIPGAGWQATQPSLDPSERLLQKKKKQEVIIKETMNMVWGWTREELREEWRNDTIIF